MRRSAKNAKSTKIATGGGILVCTILAFTIPSNLKAIELSEICSSGGCTITTSQNEVTNSTPFSTTGEIKIKAQIQTFINRSTIKAKHIDIDSSGNYIANFYNYGRIETTGTNGSLTSTSVYDGSGYRNIYNYGYISSYVHLSQNENIATNIINYGEKGGVVQNQNASKAFTIDNRGTINLFQQDGNGKKIHFKNIKSLTLQNYAMQISKGASVFNGFDGNATDNSHLVLDNVVSVNFADSNAKMILDFGGDFKVGKGYKLDKLIVKADDGTNALSVDFSRLTTRTSLYKLTQSGDSFIAIIDAPNSEIGILYKSNVRTMNNFHTLSNAMIYLHKYKMGVKRTVKKRKVIRRVKKVSAIDSIESSLQTESNATLSSLRESQSDSWQSTLDSPSLAEGARGWVNTIESLESLESLASNESFSYKSDSNNQTRRRIATTNRTLSNQNDKYYFVLTPFVAHNLFFESGRYNLSGLEYGFLTAFSGKLTPSNTLGTHFMMSYGTLGDSKDKDFSITNLNLNVGLNYKFDMIWDMYLKARGDFFYFLNQVKTLTMPNAIKPNTFGFGVSVAYGKDFNFGNGGILGIEGGIDYKALQSNTIELHDNTYQKNLYNLIYVDLGLNHNKYFNTNIGLWGINTALEIKGNITANKLSKSQIHINNLNRDINMVLDNDKILAYANISASYVLNHKDFDMEFSLAYYGNYGDRVISNGGGVEWRVLF